MLVKELLDQVSGRIAGSNDEVASRVVDTLVEKELTARRDAFLAVLAKLEEAKKVVAKIKPDGETYAVNADGSLATEPIKTFSKKAKDELAKAQKEVAKLEEALNKALNGDFSKVKELASGKAKPSAESDSEG